MSDAPLPLPRMESHASGLYGLPADLFRRLWSIDDVCDFCGVERDKARHLLAADGAPPRLRMGSERCLRWNPVQVVVWLHGDDWKARSPRPRPMTNLTGAAGLGGTVSGGRS